MNGTNVKSDLWILIPRNNFFISLLHSRDSVLQCSLFSQTARMREIFFWPPKMSRCLKGSTLSSRWVCYSVTTTKFETYEHGLREDNSLVKVISNSNLWKKYFLMRSLVSSAFRGKVGNSEFCYFKFSFFDVALHFQLHFDLEKVKWKRICSVNFFYRKSTIAAIEKNNDMYCLQKRIEKFPLNGSGRWLKISVSHFIYETNLSCSSKELS